MFKNTIKKTDKSVIALLAVLFFVLVLGYVLPVALIQSPSGTDVYTHVFYTKVLTDSGSLDRFYDLCIGNRYLGYDYPFGLWLFTSLVSRITGLDLYLLSYLTPILLAFVVAAIFYAYSSNFLTLARYRLLSVILLFSMPIVAITLLNYSTSVFSIPILLVVMHLVVQKHMPFKKFALLISIMVFCLCITHTGTYMFLFFFAIVYVIFIVLLSGKTDNKAMFLVFSLLIFYGLSVNLFPNIHPQYLDKARLLITVGNFLSSKLYVPFASELGKLFYERVFLNKNMLDIILWSTLIYAAIGLIVYLRHFVKSIIGNRNNFLAGIPIIGNASTLSHSVLAIPFWIGPIHSLFSVLGFFKLNSDGKALLIASLLVTVLPGSLVTSYTGVLREIFYLLITIPVVSVLGYQSVEEKLQRRSKHLKIGLVFIILSTAVVSPLVGNLYYKPDISGSDREKSGLSWLKTIGSPDDGASGMGYRQMINYFSEKQNPESTTISAGSEMRGFLKASRAAYYSSTTESAVYDLSTTYNLKFFIYSDRVQKNFGGQKDLFALDRNKVIDKIYFNGDMGLYESRQDKLLGDSNIASKEDLVRFDEPLPRIQEVGSDLLVQTSGYKLRLSKSAPLIKYLGDNVTNYIGEGYYLMDYLQISWYSQSYSGKYSSNLLTGLNYSVSASGNKIVYKRVLTGGNSTNNEPWGTVIIRFTFYDRSIQNEVVIVNDWLPDSLLMNAQLSTMNFMPLTYFTYEDWYGDLKTKRMYPSEDYSRIKDKKFKSIFLNDGLKGIYIRYGDTSPNPANILYKGVTTYDYGQINLDYQEYVQPGDSLHITRFISIGDEKTAKDNVDRSLSMTVYPYPEGRVPFVLASYVPDLETYIAENSQILNANIGFSNRSVRYAEALNTNYDMPSLQGIFKDNQSTLLAYGKLSEFENLKKNAKEYYDEELKGMVPSGLHMGLNDLRSAKDSSMNFLISNVINSPMREYFQEGVRNPRFVYFNGNQTDIMLFPISGPSFTQSRSISDLSSMASSWKSTINSAVDNDNPCVFMWRSSLAGVEENAVYLHNVSDYALSKGLVNADPGDLAEHMRLMRNVSILFSKDVDSVKISVRNLNEEQVNSAAFKLILPTVFSSCNYISVNGRVSRIINNSDYTECLVYVSVDLSPGEAKEVYVMPRENKKLFLIDMTGDVFMGTTNVHVKDSNNLDVSDATLVIDNRRYVTGGNGVLDLKLPRGMHNVRVEKPGFKTEDYNFEVKGRINFVNQIRYSTYIFLLLGLMGISVIYYFLRKRARRSKYQGTK